MPKRIIIKGAKSKQKTLYQKRLSEAREQNKIDRVPKRKVHFDSGGRSTILSTGQEMTIAGTPIVSYHEETRVICDVWLCPGCAKQHEYAVELPYLKQYMCMGCGLVYDFPRAGKVEYEAPDPMKDRIPIENPDWIK